MTDALILAGAVSQGAFTAGAVAALFEPDEQARIGLDVRRVIGASSGSLTGAFVASMVRSGTSVEPINEIWLDDASFGGVFQLSLDAVVHGTGVSSGQKLRALLEKFVLPCKGVNPIELSVVVANIDGDVQSLSGTPATTFEHCFRFSEADFDSAEQLSHVFDAVVGSAAFPVLFEPVPINVAGRTIRCIDGGATNNAPIKYALDGDSDVDRVFVITPYPRVSPNVGAIGGIPFLFQLAEVLIQERLFRDLQTTASVNEGLRALAREFPNDEERARILAAIGWSDQRIVEIVEVRPSEMLKGDALSGFLSKSLRQDYLMAGRYAARAAVANIKKG